MSELTFEPLEARAESYAAQPTLLLRLRITETTGTPVHAIALRVQIRIEPQRRTYEPAEEQRLFDVFGPTRQWGDSLRPFLWTHTSAMVLAFTGVTEVDLPVVCSYDMEVAGNKYLHALDGGEVGLQLLFSGTVFSGDSSFSARPVSWSSDATFRLPVQVWRDTMDTYFPNSTWVRLSRDTFDALAKYKSDHVLPDWDLTVERLLKEAGAVTAATDRFAGARSVADAVLYEGYVLYPYRASAAKNQLRWQFGVLVPPAVSATDPSERSACRTECIVDPGQTPELLVRLRFLQVQHRSIEALAPDGESFRPVDALDVDGVRWVEWDEAVEHEVDADPLSLLPVEASATVALALPGGREVEPLVAADGSLRGRIVRRRERLDGTARIEAGWADGPGALLRVRATVDNTSRAALDGAARDEVVRHSLVGLHTLLALDDGAFVSLLDPPAHAAEAVAGCRSDGTHPVLVGAGTGDDVVLSSPIILYDHPVIAPESQGDMFDATEIDEILALRVLTLTDEEKAEARGTDARAAAIVDRWEDMPPEIWERLHGTMRAFEPEAEREPAAVPWWEPAVDAEVDPWSDTLRIGDVDVAKGTKVRLRPSRRSDAHDMFVAGMDATVAGVFHDVDGDLHVAVTVDDDPASAELDWQGRYLFFHPEEIEVRT